MPEEKAAELLNALQPDDRTAFLSELSGSAVKELLKVLTPEHRAKTLELLGYAEDSVGRLMTPDYVTIKMSETCQDVLNIIRHRGKATESLNFLFVIDDKGVLIDDINIKDFLVVDPADYGGADHGLPVHRAECERSAERSDKGFRNNSRFALPAIDNNGVLLGIVTLDDVLRLSEKEDTREMQKIGGSEALDEPYNTISFRSLIKKRAGWLVILFLGEMLTATAMGHFEGEISKAVVLALFIPLIISSGGNSGSQASSIIIRAMALGEIGFRDWWRVIRRESFRVWYWAPMLGIVGFFRVFLWQKFSFIQLWRALDAGGFDRLFLADRGCDVGNDFRQHAAAAAEKAGGRSGRLFRAFCRDPGGCDRADHLFFRGVYYYARKVVVRGVASCNGRTT